MKFPPNVPEEPAPQELSTHESDNESSTDPEDAEQRKREDTRTKWKYEYEANSGTKYGMEDQLQQLIQAITDSSTTATTMIRESNHEEFGVVRDRLESIFNIISTQTQARPLLQDNPSINTES